MLGNLSFIEIYHLLEKTCDNCHLFALAADRFLQWVLDTTETVEFGSMCIYTYKHTCIYKNMLLNV